MKLGVVLVLVLEGCGARSTPATGTILATGGDPDAVAILDVDRDGVLDLVIANPVGGTVSVLRGDGKRQFRAVPGSPFAAGASPADVGAGDFDGDGNLDLVIPNHQTPHVTLLRGDGKGAFSPAPGSPFTITATPHPHGVAVGHFCGPDKPLDVVVDSWGTNEVELLIGDGAGHLADGPRFAAGPGTDEPLRAADLDGNGTLDVVMPGLAIGRWNANTASALLGDGRCGFATAPGSPFAAGAEPWTVTIADLDRDGKPDLVILPYAPQVTDPAQVAVTVLLGDGTGGFHAMPGSPFALPECARPRRAAVGDLDGDGVADIAVTCSDSDRIVVLYGVAHGGYHATAMTVPGRDTGGPPSDRNLASRDLDGDGKDDLVITNGDAGTITLVFGHAR